MNASDAIAGYRPPNRADYEPVVRGLLPFCEGEELQLRAGLLMMRDRALATKSTACQSSWELLDIVERESAFAAFRTMPIDDLKEWRRLCVLCVMAASGFDQIYQPRLPGSVEGEADGRA